MLPTRLSGVASLILLSWGLASSASAQTCDVRNRYRIANSHSGAGSELNVDTGWLSAAPLSTPGFNNNPGTSCSSQGSCTPTADFGYLRVVGTGAANNGPTGGVVLFLDQGPQASFRDTMTVVSSTLPWGANVQVRFTISLDGFATVIDTSPSVSQGATVNASSLGLSLSAPGIATGVLATTVGAQMLVVSDLSIALYAYGLLGFGIPPAYGSYAVDLTARVGITCLTPGASLTFCSGRTYPTLVAEVHDVGGGCGAGSPVLSATLPLLGQTQTYTLGNAPATQPVFLAFALGGATTVPVGPCTVTEDVAGAILLLVGVTDGAGANVFGLALPAAPGLAGQLFTVQELVLAPSGPMLGIAQLSNGLQSTVGP